MDVEKILMLGLSWIPILAVAQMVKTVRGNKSVDNKNKQIDTLQNELEQLRTEVEQLRNTATGFDLSFDRRLSEIELQARLSKLSDATTTSEHQQLQRGEHP